MWTSHTIGLYFVVWLGSYRLEIVSIWRMCSQYGTSQLHTYRWRYRSNSTTKYRSGHGLANNSALLSGSRWNCFSRSLFPFHRLTRYAANVLPSIPAGTGKRCFVSPGHHASVMTWQKQSQQWDCPVVEVVWFMRRSLPRHHLVPPMP